MGQRTPKQVAGALNEEMSKRPFQKDAFSHE